MMEIILHPSVAARWWLHHLDNATDSTALLESIGHGRFRLFEPETFESDVLAVVVDDLATFPNPIASDLITGILADVQQLMEELPAEHRLQSIRHRILVPPAFVMAIKSRVLLLDAIYFSTALMLGCHLVIVNDAQVIAAARVAEEYPRLLVTRLSDVHKLDA